MRTRPLVRTAILVLLSFAASAALRAQEPGKIIDQYIKATGGSSKLSKLLTLAIEGSLTRSSDGKTGTFTFDSKSPNRYYLELIAGEQPEILAYNGKSAWHLSTQNEPATLLGQDALQLEAASTLASSRLLNLKKNKIGAALIGPAKVGSHDAFEIEFTMPTGVKRQFYFDSSSHLLLKESGLTGGVAQDTLYDDYRPESGIQVAHIAGCTAACTRRGSPSSSSRGLHRRCSCSRARSTFSGACTRSGRCSPSRSRTSR